MLSFLKSCRRSIQRKWDRLHTCNLAIRTIVFSDDLLVRSLDGNSRSLILVFSGSSVKKKVNLKKVARGAYTAEFAVIASHGHKNHVLFINDLAASYFSQDGMRDRALSVIKDYASENSITDICAIGSSMGGFGAILFSKDLPIRVVAAFAPALSLESDITDHPDWDEYRLRFGPDLCPTLQPIMEESKTSYYLIFGDQNRDDKKHIALIPNAPNVSAYIVNGRGHGVARWLKEEGALSGIVEGMFDDNTEQVAHLISLINASSHW